MKMFPRLSAWPVELGLGLAVILSASVAGAITISHATNDLIIANGGTVAVTPAFGTLVSGGTVGTAAIDFGVDYSSGGVEGIFLNGGSTHGLGG